jgi:insecticidal toxin complex protein TccC
MNMNTSVFSRTPSVAVYNARGQGIREIQYYRHPDTPDTTEARITRHGYDARGSLTQSADPRLYAAGRVNFTWLTDLTGAALHADSVDAGPTASLNDAAGRPAAALTAEGMLRTWLYEGNTLPGRLTAVTEKSPDGAVRTTERYVWSAATPEAKPLNLAGQCVRHYDTAGRTQINSVALSGAVSSESVQRLADGAVADWQGSTEAQWGAPLTGMVYVSQTTTDVTGNILTLTDATDNIQRLAWNVAGQLAGSWLTLKGGTEQIIVRSLTYSAAGQRLREEHGNGVVTLYAYEPQTQRLTGVKTERPAGHAAGEKVLQDLRYAYDPVGNVLTVGNAAEAPRFWRNQKVVAQNTYAYDSLYQLASATGREMANAGQQGSTPPAGATFDSATYTNYARQYCYDGGGNLTQIRHSAPAVNNNYTTDITVSNRSNRALVSTFTTAPQQVDAFFTAAGNQKQLQPGQVLSWTVRGELAQVAPVTRNGEAADREDYRYDGNSQRVSKTTIQKTGDTTRTRKVIYLPGLELRSVMSGSRVTELLQVTTVGEAGRAQVRVLHWEGVPPEGIVNNQVRYSYGDLIQSAGLEVDQGGNVISAEEYYPYGGTAVLVSRNQTEVAYKSVRYSGQERDATGLYYYGYRYYQPWSGRWLSADPAGTVDGLNLYRMVRNNPTTLWDDNGLAPKKAEDGYYYHLTSAKNLASIVERGFIPQGSAGPTLSEGDLLKRQQGTLRAIYNQVASIVNKGAIPKNKIAPGNFIMPDEFWQKFQTEAGNIIGDTSIESIDVKLKNAIELSAASLDKAAFGKKYTGLNTTSIDKERQGILSNDVINKIIMQKPVLQQQKEAENTKGYIYMAATKNTLEKYAGAFKAQAGASADGSQAPGLIILAIHESVFSEGILEEDMQEPDSAVRYQGQVNPESLGFVNTKGEIVGNTSNEVVLNYESALSFIRKRENYNA